MTTLTESQFRNGLVATALNQVGHLYRDSAVPTNWPPDQFDCSVFTHWVNEKYGVDIDEGDLYDGVWPRPEPRPWHKYPGYTGTQETAARRLGATIPYEDRKPGDRLYYKNPETGLRHVTFFIGDGKVVHAAGTRYGVIVSPVVPPGVRGHGDKLLTMVVSATKFARAAGYKFSTNAVTVGPKPTVFLAHVLSAIKKDGPAAQGHTTFKSEVLLVEKALHDLGLLLPGLVDGSAGTASFGQGSAYQRYQKSLGYSGSDADGIPGRQSLTALGRKFGFNVV